MKSLPTLGLRVSLRHSERKGKVVGYGLIISEYDSSGGPSQQVLVKLDEGFYAPDELGKLFISTVTAHYDLLEEI